MLDGVGWSVGLAAALFAFALLFVLLDLQAPESVLWTGHHVVVTEQHGLATFRWQGQSYTVDVPGFGSGPVDIYFNPGNPSAAMAENVPDRLFAALFVGRAGDRRRGRAPGRPDPEAALGAPPEPQTRVLRQRPGPGLRRPAVAGAPGRPAVSLGQARERAGPSYLAPGGARRG